MPRRRHAQRRLVALLLAAAFTAAPAAAQAPLLNLEARLGPQERRDEADRRYADHIVDLRAGVRYRIAAESEDFDTVIQLRRTGTAGEVLAENDDGGDGLNSRMAFTPRESGPHVVRVLGFAGEAAGAYRVSVEPLPPLPAPATLAGGTREVVEWDVYRGTLSESDMEVDGRHAKDFAIRLEAGRTLMVRLDAVDDSFDPMIHLLSAADREGEPVAMDDDGGAGTNSFLIFDPETSGDYVLRVTAYSGTGDYVLRIAR
jgi:hypothetical protein